jgi:acetyl-CoA/propionyl-CoA carboxylase biotin carboxyl carrier protein
MFGKVLIANRGEVAVRISRTCRELGIRTVALHSDVDAAARHVALADEAVHLPGVAPSDTYLNVDAVIEAGLRSGVDAVHPGYGFLSERADVAEAVTSVGLVWVGPTPDAIRAAGDKVQARRLAKGAGVEPVPGTLDPVEERTAVLEFGRIHGYPVAIKAAGGGGGRGLKVARSADEVHAAWESAVREAMAYFGSEAVYLERYLARPKHVEVQVLAPRAGEAMSLGARDCSLQRRHQKLVEETPPPLFEDVVPSMGRAAVAVADACRYVNAGTVEFLVDEDGRFYFLEINARLQVEHTITEEVLGVDLVAAQLRIAAGEPLGFSSDDLAARGHAIECRINAEDPARGFLPSPGRIRRYRQPGGPGIRVDSGFAEGDEIPGAYDSLIGKLVAWGSTREEARRRMLRALDEFEIEGIETTIPAHRTLLRHPDFVDGTYTIRTVEEEEAAITAAVAQAAPPADPRAGGHADGHSPVTAVLLVQGVAAKLWHPAVAGSVPAATPDARASEPGVVVAPMHGTILKVLVSQGDAVRTGQAVAVLETMKMETSLISQAEGTVETVHVEAGSVVETGQIVARIG